METMNKAEKQVSLDEVTPYEESVESDQAESAEAPAEESAQQGMQIPVSELSPHEEEIGEDNISDEDQEAQPENSEDTSVEGADELSPTEIVYIALDADDAGRLIGQSILQDDIETLEQTSHAINAGQNLIIDWTESQGGKVITAGGDEALVSVPMSAAEDLENIRSQYTEIVGATLTIGVGLSPSEAGKALLYGKVHGKDQVVVFDEEIESDLTRVKEHPETEEEQKQADHYLSATDHEDEMQPHDEELYFGEESPEEGMQSEMADDSYENVDPENMVMDDNFQEDELSPEDAAQVATEGAEIETQDQDDDNEIQNAMKDELSQPESPLKQKLGELLEAYQMEKEQLEQYQQSNPELYQEVISLLHQMIKVARLLSPEDQAAEDQSQPPVDMAVENGEGVLSPDGGMGKP